MGEGWGRGEEGVVIEYEGTLGLNQPKNEKRSKLLTLKISISRLSKPIS